MNAGVSTAADTPLPCLALVIFLPGRRFAMNTDTRIERPNAARLARFDATRLDRPELGYPARHRLNEDLETRRLMVVPQLAVGQVPVPLPTRAPGAAMRQVQDVPARRPVGVLAKLRNSLGRFRP